MLFQLVRQDESTPSRSLSFDGFLFNWEVPTLYRVIKLLQNEDSSALQRRAIFLIVEGLYVISNHFGDNMLLLVVIPLGNLAQDYRGHIVVCHTSSVSAPLELHLNISRIRKLLPCSPLKLPTTDNEPVFKTRNSSSTTAATMTGHWKCWQRCLDLALQTMTLTSNSYWSRNCS